MRESQGNIENLLFSNLHSSKYRLSKDLLAEYLASLKREIADRLNKTEQLRRGSEQNMVSINPHVTESWSVVLLTALLRSGTCKPHP